MKLALVTGSRRGIGLAIADEFLARGYRVILSDVAPAEEVSDILSERRNAEYIRCDISNFEERQRLFTELESAGQRLDVLVNNAGVAPKIRADILDTTGESFDFVMNINLRGTFFMCQEGANHMIRALKSGGEEYRPRIINISSMSAYTSSVNRGEYCISKAGVSMVTALFADRLAEFGIPVFEVRPGIIMTDMTAPVTEKYQALIDGGITPIRRFGRPRDVADCVMAAAGGQLDFATGQILNADGGFHLRRI